MPAGARRWLVVLGAFGAAAAALVAPSCATEGDVLVALPDAARDATLLDLGADLGDEAATDAGHDGWVNPLDGDWLTCQADGAPCHLTTSQCCFTGLSPVCDDAGACGDAFYPCDRASMCEAGLRCCASSAVFFAISACESSCPHEILCGSDDECPDGGRCQPRGLGAFALCVWADGGSGP